MGIVFTGDWRVLSVLTSPANFTKRLELAVSKATSVNLLLLRKLIRDKIRAVVPPALSPLTTGLKKSTKPLVDRGALFQAVTTWKVSWRAGFVGVLRNAQAPGGGSLISVAEALHEGATLKVTTRMRGMFAVLAQVSAGTRDPNTLKGRALELYEQNPSFKWKPLKPGTVAIRIPARPFIKLVFADPTVQAKFVENWEAAIQEALAGKKP